MPNIDFGFTNAKDLIAFGPTLPVRLGFDPAYSRQSMSPPNLPDTTYHALVDTGASDNCIDSAVAISLNLPIVDQARASGVNGSFEVNMHLAQIFIPLDEIEIVIFQKFMGVHLTAGGQPHHVLLGRRFLSNFEMIYNGKTGLITLNTE